MPFLDEAAPNQPGGTLGHGFILRDQLEPQEPVPLPDVLRAAAFLENAPASIALAAMSGAPYGIPPDFDPTYDAIALNKGTMFEAYPEEFQSVFSESHMAAQRLKLRREAKFREDLARSGGLGMVAAVGFGFLDPINFIPVYGAAMKIRSIARGIATVGGTAAASTVLQESLLHASQTQRTMIESVAGVGAATILAGALGGATARLSLRPRIVAEAATRDRVEMRTRLRNAFREAEKSDELTGLRAAFERAARTTVEGGGTTPLTEEIARSTARLEQFVLDHFLDPKVTEGLTPETAGELRRFIIQNTEDFIAARMSLEDLTDLAISTLDKRLLTGDELFKEHLRGLGRTVDLDTGAGGPALMSFFNPWIQGVARRVSRRLGRIAERRHLQTNARGLSEQMKALDEAVSQLEETMHTGAQRIVENRQTKPTTKADEARLRADSPESLKTRMEAQRNLVRGIMQRGKVFADKLLKDAIRSAQTDPGAYRETVAAIAEWHRLRADAFDRIRVELESAGIYASDGKLKVSKDGIEPGMPAGTKEMLDDLKEAADAARKEAGRILDDAVEKFGHIEGVNELPPIINAEFSEPVLNQHGKLVVWGGMVEADLSTPYKLRSASADFLKIQQTKIGVEHLMAPFFPGLRVALKSPSAASRLTMLRLADMGFDYGFHSRGIRSPISVETNIHGWRANLGRALIETQDAYLKYRRGIDPNVDLLLGTATIRRGKEFLGILREDAVSKVRGTQRKFLTYPEFRRRVGRAMRNNDQDVENSALNPRSRPEDGVFIENTYLYKKIPEVEEAARSWRANVFDPLRDEGISLGLMKHLDDLKNTTQASYLSRIYNVRKILAQANEFKQILRDHVSRKSPEATPAEVIKVADEIFDRITVHEAGRMFNFEELKLTRSRVFKDRVLDIDDRIIAPWLEDDIEVVGRFYERTAAPDVELVRAFGTVGMDDAIKEITDSFDKLIKGAPDAAAADKLRAQRKNDLRDIEAIRDILRGNYGQPANPNEVPTRFMKGIRRFNLMRQAGSFVLSSVPDLARPVMVHGMVNTFRDGLVPLVTNFQGLRLAAGEARLAGTAWEVVLNTRAALIADVGDDFGRHTAVERFLETGSNLTMLVNLMSPWNDALKQFTSVLTSTAILRAARKAATGKKLGKHELNRMAQLGLDEDILRLIDTQVQGAHVRAGSPDDAIALPRTVDWEDDIARTAFRAAIRREVDHAIITPGAADRPLFFSKEIGKTVLQYKSFMMAATLRISLMGLQRTDAAHLNGLALGMTLGMMSYAMKSVQYGFPLSDKPQDWALEGFDRMGAAAAVMELNNMLEVVSRGNLGLAPLIGATPTNRFSKRYKFPGAVAGPTYGLAEDLLSLGSSVLAGDMQPRDARYIRNLFAWQNVFWWDPVVDIPFEALARSFRE
jgi:hypothetical protein